MLNLLLVLLWAVVGVLAAIGAMVVLSHVQYRLCLRRQRDVVMARLLRDARDGRADR